MSFYRVSSETRRSVRCREQEVHDIYVYGDDYLVEFWCDGIADNLYAEMRRHLARHEKIIIQMSDLDSEISFA